MGICGVSLWCTPAGQTTCALRKSVNGARWLGRLARPGMLESAEAGQCSSSSSSLDQCYWPPRVFIVAFGTKNMAELAGGVGELEL